MAKAYPVPAQSVEREILVRKSRFIARALSATSREQALMQVRQARKDFPDARHHCWAYLIGDPNSASAAAMDDDGEPGGTAGKPILNVIQHKAIGDVLVVVIRYFGGIKLGAGGLTRAYAQATEAVLSELPVEQQEPRLTATLTMDFAHEQVLRHWAGEHGAEILEVTYGEQVGICLDIPEAATEGLAGFCAARNIRMHSLPD